MNAEQWVELFARHQGGIERALDGHAPGDGDAQDFGAVVRRLVTEPNVTAWVRDQACIIVEWREQSKTVHFWIATGELADVIDLSHEILDRARANGFTRATLIGRRGWTRALKAEGWTETAVVLQRDIGD